MIENANKLAIGLITLAIIAVIVGGNGGKVIVEMFGSALSWSARLFTQLTGRSKS